MKLRYIVLVGMGPFSPVTTPLKVCSIIIEFHTETGTTLTVPSHIDVRCL